MFPSSERLSPKTIIWVKASACALTRNGSRQKNSDAQNFVIPMISLLLKNGIHVPFGCNLCISQIIRNIGVQVCSSSCGSNWSTRALSCPQIFGQVRAGRATSDRSDLKARNHLSPGNGQGARWPHRVQAGLALVAGATRSRAENRRSPRSSVWPHSIAQDLGRLAPAMQFFGIARRPPAQSRSIESIRSVR